MWIGAVLLCEYRQVLSQATEPPKFDILSDFHSISAVIHSAVATVCTDPGEIWHERADVLEEP